MAAVQMYKHEFKEEVRTETVSSGPDPMVPRGATGNLSELDTLLQDLNSSKHTKVFKETSTTNTVNGTRPSVDSLLDELNSVGISSTSQGPPRPPPPSSSSLAGVKSASSATRELDDLMASLSDFKGEEKYESVFNVEKDEQVHKQKMQKSKEIRMNQKSQEDSLRLKKAEDRIMKDIIVSTPVVPEVVTESLPPKTPPKTPPTSLKKDKKKFKSTESKHINFDLGEEDGYLSSGSNPPPRPPYPNEKDVLAVPPPRPNPPAGSEVLSPVDVTVPRFIPVPSTPSPPPAVYSPTLRVGDGAHGAYVVPNWYVGGTVGPVYTRTAYNTTKLGSSSAASCVSDATATSSSSRRLVYGYNRRSDDVDIDEPFVRPPSGGPVKRNDNEYRWVTDQIKYEVRSPVEYPRTPSPPPVVVQRISASTLQSSVDPSYAKPHKPSPPPPPKRPSPSPPPAEDQLDSMLGSLAVRMTEQGINTQQKGCCCACDKPIVGQVITALGKTWHPDHFTCAHCHQELGTRNFFERDGKPYCEEDYHNLFSPKCSYCSGPILDKCVTALNTTWHPEHFFCAHCGENFGDDGFHEKNGKPYCKKDYYQMFAPKCGGCNAPIRENYISALNAQWHPECFVCRDCRQPFDGGSFFDHEGLPYCETHYHAKRGSLCAGCHKPITGRCITAMFRKFHPEHFVCAFCLQQLNKGTFKEQNEKPYCHTCFDKLFG